MARITKKDLEDEVQLLNKKLKIYEEKSATIDALFKKVNEIDDYYNIDLDKEDENSILYKRNTIEREINECKEFIFSKKEVINTSIEESKNNLEESKNNLEESKNSLKESENNLEELLKELKNQKLKYDNLENAIKALLPSALSTGLASSFSKEKNSLSNQIYMWSAIFLVIMIVIVYFGFHSAKDISIEAIDINFIVKNLLVRAPIYTGLIWSALYVSKRRNECNRLKEEYTHKETLAKSYSGYKEQIKELESENEDMLKDLLKINIDAISFNPSKTLEKAKPDAMPAEEILKENLGKVPNLNK